MYMRAIVILLTCGLAFARPILEGRVLLATPSNCTPPRTIADTRMPFCFVPSTISPAAQQFLATTATGATFGAVRFGNTTAEQAAAVAQLRSVFPSAFANLSAAAEAQYIGSKRNTSIGGVPAVIAVPKGVQEGSPANTKVLLYLHGKHASTAADLHRTPPPLSLPGGVGGGGASPWSVQGACPPPPLGSLQVCLDRHPPGHCKLPCPSSPPRVTALCQPTMQRKLCGHWEASLGA